MLLDKLERISCGNAHALNLTHVTSLELHGFLSQSNLNYILKFFGFLPGIKKLKLFYDNECHFESFEIYSLCLPKELSTINISFSNSEFTFQLLTFLNNVKEIKIKLIQRYYLGLKEKLERICCEFYRWNCSLGMYNFAWFASVQSIKFLCVIMGYLMKNYEPALEILRSINQMSIGTLHLKRHHYKMPNPFFEILLEKVLHLTDLTLKRFSTFLM